MTDPVPQARGWLFGPLPDLLLGCGVLYALSVVLFAFSGSFDGAGPREAVSSARASLPQNIAAPRAAIAARGKMNHMKQLYC